MELQTSSKQKVYNFNKPAYAIFMIAGIYFMLMKNFSEAVTFWGLALIFDPFDLKTPFPQRPFYQQAWLIVHLSVTIALFVLMILSE